MTRQIALDIECSPRTAEPEFDDPAGCWDTFAIGLSHKRDGKTPPDTTVLVRRDGSERALRKLLAAATYWLRKRAPHDCLLTYNGESFDLPILEGHIESVGEYDQQLADHIRSALDISHRDLFKEIVDNQPSSKRWPSLDKALSSRGIESATTKLDGEIVEGSLMPAIGERVLNPEKTLGAHERSALKKYAASDVDPLFELADCLDRERHSAAEADAVTDGGYNVR